MASARRRCATVVRRLRLPAGRVLTIRPVQPGDVDQLVALYAGLDDGDVYRRFFSGHPPPRAFVEGMVQVAQRGGLGLVAVLGGPGGSAMVAEASYELLPDGGGELGITVAGTARGWLGPYLLDVLLQAAARRGLPALQADVLVDNRRMLAMLRARGYAVVGHDEQPAVVRVAVATAGRVPPWPEPHDRRRLLVEVPGGRWHGEEAARAAGFEVVACPGPRRGWPHCPALLGQPCPLVAGADLVVEAVPGDAGRTLVAHHRRLHRSVPLCVELPAGAAGAPADGDDVPVLSGAAGQVVVGVLERLAGTPAPPA